MVACTREIQGGGTGQPSRERRLPPSGGVYALQQPTRIATGDSVLEKCTPSAVTEPGVDPAVKHTRCVQSDQTGTPVLFRVAAPLNAESRHVARHQCVTQPKTKQRVLKSRGFTDVVATAGDRPGDTLVVSAATEASRAAPVQTHLALKKVDRRIHVPSLVMKTVEQASATVPLP